LLKEPKKLYIYFITQMRNGKIAIVNAVKEGNENI
jgi:surface antigen